MFSDFRMRGSLRSHEEWRDKEFRDALVEVEIRRGIPIQIREMREGRGWTQAYLGERIGKPQNNISRIEHTRDGYLSIKTLLDFASVFDVALLVKFVPFSELARWTDNHSLQIVAPIGYEAEVADEIAEERAAQDLVAILREARSAPNVTDFELARALRELKERKRHPPKKSDKSQMPQPSSVKMSLLDGLQTTATLEPTLIMSTGEIHE
jgi:transcriptional regulator with XRE-family HTH domain